MVQENTGLVTLGHDGVQGGTVPRELLLCTSLGEAEGSSSLTTDRMASPLDTRPMADPRVFLVHSAPLLFMVGSLLHPYSLHGFLLHTRPCS